MGPPRSRSRRSRRGHRRRGVNFRILVPVAILFLLAVAGFLLYRNQSKDLPATVAAPGPSEVAQEGSTPAEETAGSPEEESGVRVVATGYVVLGGSLSCGFDDYSGGGFPERYATLYGEDHPGSYPQVTNLCKPNTPSDAMIATLSEPTTQDALSKADIISLDNGAIEWLQARWSYKAGSCGGDDGQDCLRTLYDRYTANRKAIDDAIDASRQPGSLVFATHYYNPWTAEDMGADTYAGDGGDDDFTVLSRYLRALSDYSEADAQARGWRFVDLGLMFNGANFDADMLAAGYTTPTDRIHLTSEGHAEWAEAMREETP
jgi:hypothetical protein